MATPTTSNDQPHALSAIRRLALSDHSKGFVELLSQLTSSPPIPFDDFRRRFAELSSLGDDHLVAVAEDEASGRIVATGSVFVERKFIRGCGKAAHIEDVVVDRSARGKGLGQAVVRYLAEHARRMGCYKAILDCTADLGGFYESCGFVEKGIQMALYF